MSEAAPALEPALEADRVPTPPAQAPAGTAVARNALHLVTGQVALTALSFVLSSALGRSLGPADFGLYFFILSSTNFAYTLVDWGQSHVLVREIARDHEQTDSLLGSALVIRCVGAVLAAGGTFAALAALGYDLQSQALTALYIVIWIPSTVWMAYGMAFRAHERMDADAKVSVLNKLLTVALVMPALALGGKLLTVILAIGAAGIGGMAYAVVLARKARLPRLRVTAKAMRELMSAGTPLVVMNLLMMAQTYMEPLVVSLMTPPEILGWYGAARTITNALIMPASIITSASFPRIARASGNPDGLRHEFATALRPVLALAVLVGVGTYAFAPFAISVVYGSEKFGGAATILQAIAPTLSLMFLNLLFSTPVLVLGKANRVAAYKVLALGVSAGLAFWLVPLAQQELGNGALGVVAAFGASELLMLVAFSVLLPRGAIGRRFFVDLLRATIAGALALASLRLMPGLSEWIAMPLFVLVFAAGGLALGLFSRADVGAFVAVIRRRGSRAADAAPADRAS